MLFLFFLFMFNGDKVCMQYLCTYFASHVLAFPHVNSPVFVYIFQKNAESSVYIVEKQSFPKVLQCFFFFVILT